VDLQFTISGVPILSTAGEAQASPAFFVGVIQAFGTTTGRQLMTFGTKSLQRIRNIIAHFATTAVAAQGKETQALIS